MRAYESTSRVAELTSCASGSGAERKRKEHSFPITKERVALTTKTQDLVEVFEHIHGSEGADDDLPWGETLYGKIRGYVKRC